MRHIEMYAEVFEDEGALDKLEGFASHFGPDFYRLARNTDTITLEREPHRVVDSLTLGDESLTRYEPARRYAGGFAYEWQR